MKKFFNKIIFINIFLTIQTNIKKVYSKLK